jgi:hypothetical protein
LYDVYNCNTKKTLTCLTSKILNFVSECSKYGEKSGKAERKKLKKKGGERNRINEENSTIKK